MKQTEPTYEKSIYWNISQYRDDRKQHFILRQVELISYNTVITFNKVMMRTSKDFKVINQNKFVTDKENTKDLEVYLMFHEVNTLKIKFLKWITKLWYFNLKETKLA